ncbi:MAG: hypothetical protein HN817_00560 [Porticoccaceae bacterium]|nr:hypothetical protein [Porticoccaceae bacterium]MBT7374404.1 hypothetical protein [Porticoccaceae bacterium]
MSKPGININITGGRATLGNINQGDNNHLEANQSLCFAAADLEQFNRAIEALASQSNSVSEEDYLALRATVENLAQQPPNTDIVERLKDLYQKYAWAAAPLRRLLGLLVA